MKKLRFKNRNGILYFGIDGKFKSSKLKYTNVNKNIIINKFRNGLLNSELCYEIDNAPKFVNLLEDVMIEKSKHLKHKSLLAYSSLQRNHIVPFFKDMLVTQIKPIHIKKFQDNMINKGLKRDSIQTARILLKEVFNLAILSEKITINPLSMVNMPKIKSKKVKQKPFTLDEIDMILSSAPGVLKNFLGISFFSGIRSGELLALKWSDIDFDNDTISINKTIAQGYINSPKTKSSERDIEMLPKVKDFLRSQFLETGLKDNYLFLNRNNTYHGFSTIFYINFHKLLDKLNLEKRSLHNTRHTFASIMLNNNIEPLWVSNTLGHDNLQITLNIYTHYMPKKEKMCIEFLEKRYKNGTNNN